MKLYANVGWTAADVQTLAPRLTDDEAQEWLERNAKHIRDRLVEHGWTVMTDLLRFDGVDTSDAEDDA